LFSRYALNRQAVVEYRHGCYVLTFIFLNKRQKDQRATYTVGGTQKYTNIHNAKITNKNKTIKLCLKK